MVTPAELQGLEANARHWDPLASPEAAGLRVVAEEGVPALGLRPEGVPPDRIFIGAVEPGGWAVRAGVAPGDELIEVNGRRVVDMSEAEFRATRSKRPLTLVLQRPSSAPCPLVVKRPVPCQWAITAVNKL